jgi:AraC-like DNA-binding protein
MNYSVIGVASDFSPHDSGFHKHKFHAQILYAPSGCMTCTSDREQLILPPTKLAWLPANMTHRIQMRNVVAYRSIYFDNRLHEDLPTSMSVVNVNPLFREIIERMAYWDWKMDPEKQANILHLFWEEMEAATRENLRLGIPKDYRVQRHLEDWSKGKSQPPFLKELVKEVGASEKTISRIFSKEAGMPYQEWRLQWRLHRSIEYLAEGMNIREVAHQLDFSSESAFIHFFKKHLSETPYKYYSK